MLSDATAKTAINAMNRYFFRLCISSPLSFMCFTMVVNNAPVHTGLTEDTRIFRMYEFNPGKNFIGTRSGLDSASDVWIEERCNHHVKTLFGQDDNWLSAVLAVEEIANSFAAGGVRGLVGLERVAGFLVAGIFFTAIGAAISKAGLARFEFEFFAASYAGFDGIRHKTMIQVFAPAKI